MGIQPYPNRIRKITRYGSVTGLAPTELVPTNSRMPRPHTPKKNNESRSYECACKPTVKSLFGSNYITFHSGNLQDKSGRTQQKYRLLNCEECYHYDHVACESGRCHFIQISTTEHMGPSTLIARTDAILPMTVSSIYFVIYSDLKL